MLLESATLSPIHQPTNKCQTDAQIPSQPIGKFTQAILDQLLRSGFEVTILTRQGSVPSPPSSMTSVSVNYESLDSLINALQGQDAVVSTQDPDDAADQIRLVEAAAKAQVKRFIPSEFRSDTLNEKIRALPVSQPKNAVQDALLKEGASSGMTYSLICNGPSLEWSIMFGIFMDLKRKSISLYNGGDGLFSVSTLPTIGKAVAGTLQHPDETQNRAVYVHDTATTLKKLGAMGKKATGGEDGWTESVISVDDLYEQAWAELKKDNPDPMVSKMNFLKTALWGEGYGSHFEKTDNALFGIEEMSDDEVQHIINSLAK